ncbi:uncharacterized protein [Littorina saxatilis]|uniref:Prolamin-like domain-containing protein n=1 Tax=Littorina saxatilis TaxID=31220 RepID=A0AAN9GJR4_9CAEN
MAAKHLFTAAAVLLLVNSAVGVANTTTQICSTTERSLLFNGCLMNFGWDHWNDMAAMIKSPTCLREKLQCPSAKTVVECINNFKADDLADSCWQGLKGAITDMLLEYKFGCTFDDIEAKCWRIRGFPRLLNKSSTANNQQAAAGGRPPM